MGPGLGHNKLETGEERSSVERVVPGSLVILSRHLPHHYPVTGLLLMTSPGH